LVEAHGVPLGLAVAGANVNDFKLVRETIESVPVKRPRPSLHRPQNLCLDKGYDFEEVREMMRPLGLVGHIPSRGKKTAMTRRRAGHRARRWVVERTHSWMNRFRRVLIRWEKNPENYRAIVHLCLAWICFQCSGLFLG